MTKNTKIKGPLCEVSVSGGTLVCVLARGHAKAHSSSSERKPSQHATWTSEGGTITVRAFSHGKQMSEWAEPEALATVDDDDPRPTWLREKTAQRKPMTLEDEPADPEAGDAAIAAMDAQDAEDDSYDPFEDEVRSDADRDLARKMREEREAHAAELETGTVADRDVKPPNLIAPTGATITCRGRIYQVHAAAQIFPTPEPQYREIVESIRRDGQKHEVELLEDGTVIDGCSRLRACEEIGIDPRTKVVHVPDGERFRYVVAVNLARRHLDESRRAAAAAELATLEHGANQHTRGPNDRPVLTQAQAATAFGVSEGLVRRAVRVRNAGTAEVQAAVREGRIKVDAAVELVKLTPAKQRELLGKVTQGSGEIRAGKVRALAKQEQKREIVAKINTGRVPPMPVGPFGVIYGDYPWWYDNSDQHEGSRGHMGYPGMKMPEILAHAREAAKRADENTVLALWFTNLYVREIGAVVDAYGATVHTMWTWPKPRAGVGTWGRGQTEHLVIASIGKPVHTLNEVSTLLPAYALREPGRKPDEVAELLAKHCSGPHLELFAREPREGWTTWGAEADGSKAIERKAPEPDKPRPKILTLTDRCAKCSREFGEHDGMKCPPAKNAKSTPRAKSKAPRKKRA